jgi:hypothetical protein
VVAVLPDPLGSADCEALRDLAVAQPVNTLSAAALAAVGIWLMRRALQVTVSRRSAMAFGAATVLAGVGSVDYHGTQSGAAVLFHDGGAALLAALAVTAPVMRRVRRQPVAPGWSTTRAAALAIAAVVAAAAYVGGRTGSALCAPASVVQLHAVWHVMVGVLAVLWAGALWPVRPGVRAAVGAS